jgi:hypothetical protein
MTIYKSKIGPELVIPITLILISGGIFMGYEKIWIGFILILILAAFIVHIFLATYYQVGENSLRVKCGLLFDKTIPLDAIKKIKETDNFISAPATSLDRLEITYNKHDILIISPKEKEKFISHLTSINPKINIEIQNKAKQNIYNKV